MRCPLQPIWASSSRILEFAELGELHDDFTLQLCKEDYSKNNGTKKAWLAPPIPVLPVPTSTPTWRFSIGPAPLAADSGRSPGFLYLAPFSLTSETPNSSHGGTQAKVRLNKLLVILVLLDL